MAEYYIKILEKLSTILSLASFYLGMKQRSTTWMVNIFISCMNMPVYYANGLYASVFKNIVNISISLYGWYTWKFGGKNRTELKRITRTSWDQLSLIAILSSLYTYAMHLLTQKMHGSLTFLDALRASLVMVGMWVTSYKKLETYIVWFFVNLVAVILCYKKDMLWFAGKYFFFMLLSIYSYVEWFKKYREQTDEEGIKET